MNYKKRMYDNYRKSEVSTLSECIEDLLNYYKLKAKFNQTNVVASWEKIMGKTIASRTDKIFFKQKTLYVKITSAPLKHQLNTAKSKVIELINKEYGEQVIEEVVFL